MITGRQHGPFKMSFIKKGGWKGKPIAQCQGENCIFSLIYEYPDAMQQVAAKLAKEGSLIKIPPGYVEPEYLACGS